MPGPVSTYYVYYSFLVSKLHYAGVFTNSYRTLVVLLRHNLSGTSAARAAHMDIVHGRVTYQKWQKKRLSAINASFRLW